jgi:hypothetical protein
MAVVTVTTLTVKPDRYQEYLDQVARKAKPIIEKAGGKNVRLLAGLVAGQATGSLVFIFEADDFSAFGATSDKFLADPEFVALMSTGTASPVASYQATMWVDVPL